MSAGANSSEARSLGLSEPGRRAAGDLGWSLLGLFAAELVLLAASYRLNAPWSFWLAGHLLLVAAFAVRGWRHREPGRDLSEFGLTVLAVLIGGPAAAALVALALPLWRRQRVQPALLAAWYDRIALSGDIDAVTRLADTVAMGRALRTNETLPRPFADVMASGSLADRQTALGLIARHFSPAYADALKAALVTGEPLVRVQAAAVAVKVRGELKSAVRGGIAQAAQMGSGDGTAAADLSRALRDFVATGLLEDDDCVAANAAIARLVAIASNGAGPLTYEGAMRAHLETELLRSGDYAGFRAMRANRSDAAAGPVETVHGR